MTRQDQDVGAGGLAVQSGQDTNVVVINNPVSQAQLDQMREIATTLAEATANLTHLIARPLARDRIADFDEHLLKRIAEGKGNPEAFADPDFQHAVFEAQKSAARSGDDSVRDTLVDLIARRSLEKKRTRRAIVLAEAATKIANLTDDEFAALSLTYMARYTVSNNIADLPRLGSHIQDRLIPFAKNVSREQSSFWHLQAESCANIEMGHINLFDSLRQAYGGVLGDGFTREQLESHLPDGRKNALDEFIMPCLNDPTKLQPRTLNFEALKQIAVNTGLTENELRNVWNLFEGTMAGAPERLTSVAPDFQFLLELWNSTPLKNLSLTSVGIAIAHANAVRVIGLDAPLSIWIK